MDNKIIVDYFIREGGYEKVSVDTSVMPYKVTREFTTEKPQHGIFDIASTNA